MARDRVRVQHVLVVGRAAADARQSAVVRRRALAAVALVRVEVDELADAERGRDARVVLLVEVPLFSGFGFRFSSFVVNDSFGFVGCFCCCSVSPAIARNGGGRRRAR